MSMDLNQAPAEVLNDLIQTCIDGQKGFEAASKAIDDPAIRDELVDIAGSGSSSPPN